MEPLFDFGEIYTTEKIEIDFGNPSDHITELITRHLKGDWGNISNTTAQKNNSSVEGKEKSAIMSHYTNPDGMGEEIWIITEWDRSATLVLYSSEYPHDNDYHH